VIDANLSPKRTGLPFVVWISPKAGAAHDVRVTVSKGPKGIHGIDICGEPGRDYQVLEW
jgi:hypothetical protein